MKAKKLKNITVILAITLSFFLGRASKELSLPNQQQSNYNSDLNAIPNFNDQVTFLPLDVINRAQKETDTVYRCGKSKIYHPTTLHASFKRCRSRVYKLTVKRAKTLGMRHCKCSG